MYDFDRKIAYDVLLSIEKDEAYSNIELNTQISRNDVTNPAFIRELCYGVLKNKYLLDFYIDKFAKKVELKDKILLRMGMYQLLYMDSVPTYAAIDTTVELAKKLRHGKTAFINGVLRNFERNMSNLPKAKRFSVKYSIENWIVDLLISQYGKEVTEEILKASNETPNLSIRVNLKKTTCEELKNKLDSFGFDVKFSNISSRALIVKGSNLLSLKEFNEGFFSVQDESSILCSDTILSDYDGKDELIIDTCAAPGGKTLAMKEILSSGSKVISCDIHSNKLKLIEDSVLRLGLKNIEVLQNDSTKLNSNFINRFDRVLCDVPCSGFGVFRRKPEIKYKKEINLDELVKTQKDILENSSKYLKKDGILLYSTCTINKNENEYQIKDFLNRHNEYILEKEIKLLPMGGTDGFYIARLKKICK